MDNRLTTPTSLENCRTRSIRANPDRVFRVFHMASCARSGETLMLRILASHPQVAVAFDLRKKNTPEERALRTFFRSYAGSEVRESRLPEGIVLPEGVTTIIVKQGVWEHRHPFEGFVLVRNPASVTASLLAFDQRAAGATRRTPWSRLRRGPPRRPKHMNFADPRWKRLLRWQRSIDEDLVEYLEHLDYIGAVCAFYNRRMLPLANSHLPVVHYERLVSRPRQVLRLLLDRLGLEFDDRLLDSHRDFDEGTIGHGKNELARPIDEAGLFRFREVLSREEFGRILALTLPSWKAFRYRLAYDDIAVDVPDNELAMAVFPEWFE